MRIRSRRLASTTAALTVAIACALSGVASAAYPGRDGSLVYELSGTWVAGNLGACDVCSGALSGIFRFDAVATPKPMDDCLYASSPVTLCGGGVPILMCSYSEPPDEMCSVLHPSFSPDGRRLVYDWTGETACSDNEECVLRGNAPDTLVIADADGTNAVSLPALTADDTEPAFLPSGNEIVFAGYPATGATGSAAPIAKEASDLYEVSTAGAGLRRLTGTGASQPAPCEDGSIAYVHAGNLYLLGPSGRTRRLTVRGGQRPDCSPNSRQIAFVRGRGLYLVRISDDRVTRLPTGGVLSGPAFSPDGRELAITRGRSIRTSGCLPAVTAIDSIEFLRLNGQRAGALHRISDDAIDDSDCGGHNVAPGAITWGPR